MIFLLSLSSVPLFCEGDGEALNAISDLQGALTMVWVIVAAALVFFMQAGFAMVETGLTRAKNASNIMMKNLMDFCMGAIAFMFTGFAIMFGADQSGLFGTTGWFLSSASFETLKMFMFQVVFAATAATIVSGSMAERTKFSAYMIYSVFISALIYPISGHWIWGGGWLANLGFHDFAGSTVVHSVGGWAALMGAILIGPRIGKYLKTKNGKTEVRAIPGHNMPLAALGVFILWFGWFGFNAGSTVDGNAPQIASIAVTTTLAAAAGAIAALFTSWILFKKPDTSMSLNGALAGLVAITAPTAVVNPGGAVIIGLIAGILVVLSVEFFDKVLHIDDPVGAISVHGVCGAFGTLAVGLFATPEGAEYAGIKAGLFFGGGLEQLGIQALGAVSVFAWVAVTAGILFGVLKVLGILRVSVKEEMMGLDISEHGNESYSGFQVFSNQ
ncbi:MAG: ammonium transporter [Spirochaetales bacterium]|nr:ammonium transporter [Spirochaetales bacterium]